GEGHPAGLDAGYFMKPTVFVNVRNDMTIAQEEIFGPVLSVIAYDSEDDAIRIANDSKYGLHAAVLGTDLQRAHRVASQIRAGRALRRVHGRQGPEALSGTALSRGARSGVRGSEQVRRHDALRRAEHNFESHGGPGHRGGVLHGASPHRRGWEANADDRSAPLLRHVRQGGRHVAVLRTLAVRRLDRGARVVMTPVAAGKRLVIVGATGMVGGYAVRYALDRAAVGGVTTIGRK